MKRYIMSTGTTLFDQLIVEAESELSAKRKFLKYVREHPDDFMFEGSKFPTLNTKFEDEVPYCLELREDGGLYYDDLYLGRYEKKTEDLEDSDN